jgi:hypothetical protein
MAYNTKLVARFITSLVRIESAFAPIFRRLILIRGLQGGLEWGLFAFCFQTANYLALRAQAIEYTPEMLAGKTLR